MSSSTALGGPAPTRLSARTLSQYRVDGSSASSATAVALRVVFATSTSAAGDAARTPDAVWLASSR